MRLTVTRFMPRARSLALLKYRLGKSCLLRIPAYIRTCVLYAFTLARWMNFLVIRRFSVCCIINEAVPSYLYIYIYNLNISDFLPFQIKRLGCLVVIEHGWWKCFDMFFSSLSRGRERERERARTRENERDESYKTIVWGSNEWK